MASKGHKLIPPNELEAFLSGYLGESEEHLSNARKQIELLGGSTGKGVGRVPAVRELFRALHTIKGLSAMVGVQPVVDVAHAMEDILREADSSARIMTPRSLQVLGQGLLAIDKRIAEVAQRKTVTEAPQSLLRDIESLNEAAGWQPDQALQITLADQWVDAQLNQAERAQVAAGLAQNQRAMRVDFRPSRQRSEEGISITSVRQAVEAIATLVKVVPMRVEASTESPTGLAFALIVLTSEAAEMLAGCAHAAPADVIVLAAPQVKHVVAAELDQPVADDVAEAPNGTLAMTHEASFVRVDIERLDAVLDHLSSLVITRFNLEQQTSALAEQGYDARPMRLALQDFRRQLRDLRVAVMGARMVSVADVLSRAPLIARGAAAQLGKQVDLQIHAGGAVIDKAVGERLLPAIIHLIRNAIDHGIETPAVREAAGKPPRGTVQVRAWQEGSSWLALSLEDDGAGINAAALARKAGKEPPQNDADLLDLLATPGLSVRDEATTSSGRGVGVDAVWQIARHQLRGDMQVSTRLGEGTVFTLKVPVSLAIIDAFAFRSEGQRFAVPVSTVDEIIDIGRDSLTAAPTRGTTRAPARMLHRERETIPVVTVKDALGQRAWNDTSLAPSLMPPKALIIRRNGTALAFQVDRMLGQQEIVVRPMTDPLVQVPGISGAADLGDGQPTLVLDLYALHDQMANAGVRGFS